MMKTIEAQTLDGCRISDGLRVWDYDLDRVVIDLSRVFEEINQNDGSVAYWFDVQRVDGGGRKLMSNTRVWRSHPFTGEAA